uniref:ARAD1D12188p n=1 Tax=Blastobotrys adeninivorans TaxID=409370 RepID=A0A060T925_BLAAD
MTYQVKVTGLNASTTQDQVQEFFSFCGRVSGVVISPPQSEKESGSATVTFEKPAAVKTALLLTDSELAGSKVTISADEKTIAEAEQAAGQETPENATKNGQEDISQEYKPRATILAEYLAQGYVLGDRVIDRGLELDAKHGISSRFTHFLQDLDSKYKVRDRAEATDRAYGITDKLGRYFDQAIQTPTGSKLHSYYTELVRNVTDVHNEARRLADLKKQSSEPAPAPAASS